MNSGKMFASIMCVILVSAASSPIALGYNDPAAYRLITGDSEEVPEAPLGPLGMSSNEYQEGVNNCSGGCDMGCQPCGSCPRWTATADFIIMDRFGGTGRTLVRPIRSTDDLLNSSQFHQGFHGGPRVGLIRHGDRCYDLEVQYFQIDGWRNSQPVPANQTGLAFDAPGYSVISFSDPMNFDYSSKLYSGEINLRWNPLCRVTMLAGFRWLELRENLDGSVLTPTNTPFWNTNTRNDLFGFQIGSDAILWERGRLSIDGLLKAGVFSNQAEQTSTAIAGGPVSLYDSTNHTAFLSEMSLQAKYQATKHLTLRIGYQLMWLEGLALAPAQIEQTNFLDNPDPPHTGIDSHGGVWYHGATAGFEYSF